MTRSRHGIGAIGGRTSWQQATTKGLRRCSRQLGQQVLAEVGVAVLLHDRAFIDLGVVHVPQPVEVGDIVAREHGAPLRVVEVVDLGGDAAIRYVVEVEPIFPRPQP